MKMSKIVLHVIMVIFCITVFSTCICAEDTFTPDGNMTLIDDVVFGEKQFITVQSRNGNCFYIVIDRSRESDNVYFLNLVDEADLVALVGEKAVQAEKNELIVEEPEQKQESKPEVTTEKSGNTLVPVLLIIIVAGGAVFCYFKFIKGKHKKQDTSDADDIDMDDADGEKYETEDDENKK